MPAQAAEIDLGLLPLPADLHPIQMDSTRIRQALGNLIENALQYTPKGGRITVQSKLDGDKITSSVCDIGVGIPTEDLPYVFERFFRADSSRQREKCGRGLGLAIVKQIVEAHQGESWVESKSGQGAVFTSVCRFRPGF